MSYFYRGTIGNYGYGVPTPTQNTAGTMMPPQPMTGTQGMMPVQQGPMAPSGAAITPSGNVYSSPFQQSFIENILRLNLGKPGTFYMTYENNSEWNAKIFKGVLEAAGRDHIIISDPVTGQRTLLLMVNLDYATFDQPLVYSYPGVIGNPGNQ